ncbi:zinc-dependent metalloprotease [Pendulispora brunnea]|uniref:Zinc-dependent metalloprotease n=1 Tax=Pendulispora brunnea TaxID=2905690 RepID=A0ABZ2KH29_9BACT
MSLARTFRGVHLSLALVAPAVVVAAGCAQTGHSSPDESNVLSKGDAFVAIDRPPRSAAQGLVTQSVPSTDTPRSFYLAINRRELGERYFLTAYVKDYYPGTVGSLLTTLGVGAAISLGVRVVTFREQNGKLFVFDAANNYATSDTFDPSLIIEAYPIVKSSGFDELTGSENYVLFDPAAGLNRFGALSDSFASGSQPSHFQIDLAFLQKFRKLSDGVTFEEVFTGFNDDKILNPRDGLESNRFKVSGTLGLSLRRYLESPDYVASALPSKEFYFRSARHSRKNTGTASQTPIKWNIHPGGKPITWLLSNHFLELKDDPVYAPYDIVGALERGIERWNDVFGFKALQVKVGSPDDSFADDDKNYIIFDADPTQGFALANERTNPNTGEIRGASVYFGAKMLSVLNELADDPPASTEVAQSDVTPPTHGAVPGLAWGDFRSEPLCALWAPAIAELHSAAQAAGTLPPLTKKQKFEGYITWLIGHEIGHTLGLRHNFKGSLQAPSSSVMDYVIVDDSPRLGSPRPYDLAAIKWLYGLSREEPTQPFCVDADVKLDPDCSRYDFGTNPLADDAAPFYDNVLTTFLNGTGDPPNYSLNRVLRWVRTGTPAQHLQAWKAALGPLKVPVDANKVATIPGYAARVNQATNRLFSRLYLDPLDDRADLYHKDALLDDPPYDAEVTPLIMAELKANLLNGDSIRSYATRRMTVAVLKKLQLTAALSVLVESRATIQATRPGLTGDDAVLTDELLSRIDAAVKSYFN